MFEKINKWICKNFGHKFDDIDNFMVEVVLLASNKPSILVQCKRCNATIRVTKN